MKHSRLALIAGTLALTAAVAYAQMNGYTQNNIGDSPKGKALLETLNNLDRYYLYPIDKNKVLEGAIQGALGSLDDEFTYYTPPANNQIDAENLAGEFGGIGIQLSATNSDGSGGKVDNVFKNGAAFNAGVQISDVFLKVGDKDVSSAKIDDIVRLVRGKIGTNVKITFGRNNKPYTVIMERRKVKIVSVESTVLPNKIGYVALNTFYNERASEQFRKAIADMKKKNVNKMVLDLRDNGGGLLTAGIDVTDQFLQSGNIVSLKERNGKPKVYGRASNSPKDYRGKLVVLVNKNSASASEIVSGALQDAGRAQIVGEQTFGKGVAQIPMTLADGGKVAVVNSAWLTPKGREIHKKGIKPDFLVKDTRSPIPLNFAGSGAKPGSKLTIMVDGKPMTVTADKDGAFSFTGSLQRRTRSTTQGEALVDVKNDAILRKAIELLK